MNDPSIPPGSLSRGDIQTLCEFAASHGTCFSKLLEIMFQGGEPLRRLSLAVDESFEILIRSNLHHPTREPEEPSRP